MKKYHRFVFSSLVALVVLATSPLAYSLECQQWAKDVAGYILGGVDFDTTFCAEMDVPNLHLNLLLLHGVYREGDTTRSAEVGLNVGGFHEFVTVARLAPRFDTLSTEVRVDAEEAIMNLEAFFGPWEEFPPEGFCPADSPLMVLDSLGPEKIWRSNDLVHVVDGVRVMPSACIGEVDAMYGRIITVAFHRADVSSVSLVPDIDADSARTLARIFLDDSTEYDPDALMDGESEIFVGYGNRIFHGQGWQWTDDLRLFWSCAFCDSESGEEVVQVWMHAHSPFMCGGGSVYESPVGELFCISDQQDDCVIWQEPLSAMGYEVDIHGPISTLGDVQGAISTGSLFIMQTHGRRGECGGSDPSALLTDFDVPKWFCPEDVPANDLRWAAMSCCHSATPHLGHDFTDAFVAGGADISQGYQGTVDPDLYERYQAYFLGRGETFANAHQRAKVLNPPCWRQVSYQWKKSGYNKIRLAPLLVRTWSNTDRWHPAEGDKDTVRVWAAVINRDDFRQTWADSVVAELRHLPSGFTLLSDGVQIRETLAHSETWRVFWDMMASPTDSGSYPVDVWVRSKNLGVAVHDPGDSLRHRCWVHVVKGSGIGHVEIPEVPRGFALFQNYPNPFNATTTIFYTVPGIRGTMHHTRLQVYNVAGQTVRTLVDKSQHPGEQRVDWDGGDEGGSEVASGIYFFRLHIGQCESTRCMALLR